MFNMPLNKLLTISATSIYLSITTLRTSLFVAYIPENIYKLVLLLCLLITILNELFYVNEWTKKDITFFGGVTLLGLLTYQHDGILGFTPYYLLFACRKWKIKEILKYLLFISSILFLFIIVSAKLQIIENYYSAGRVRQYLGFRYALFPQAYLANISILYLYYRQKKLTIYEIIVLLVINYFFYLKTNSRLSFYCTLLILLLSSFLKYKSVISINLLKLKIVPYIFSIFAFFSLLLAIFYQPQNFVLNMLNNHLGNRLHLAALALDKYHLSLWGKHLDFVGNGLNSLGQYVNVVSNYNYVDNLYVRLLLQYGVLFVLMLLFTSNKLLKLLQQEKDYYLLTLLCFIALRCFFDDLAIFLYYNSLWFIAFNFLYQHKYKKHLIIKYS